MTRLRGSLCKSEVESPALDPSPGISSDLSFGYVSAERKSPGSAISLLNSRDLPTCYLAPAGADLPECLISVVRKSPL